MKSSIYLVYSPFNNQALAISKFLRKYFPSTNIIGIAFHGEARAKNSAYDQIIEYGGRNPELENGLKIPTGAFATKCLLEEGDIVVGAITLSQSMLNVFNKPWMLSQATKAGISIPKTWDTIDASHDFYPLFYKQRYERGGGVRGIAFSSSQIPEHDRENLIFQEFIGSRGTYGVGFLADQGHILAAHAHFESESFPKEGGSAVFIESCKDLLLLKYTNRLVKSLNYSGWGLAEFKYCPQRKDYIFMEINAKFWSSCEFAFLNEPLFLKLLFGIESKEKKVEAMVFLDNAISRGLFFMIRYFYRFLRNHEIRLYKGWSFGVFVKLMPNCLKPLLKKLR